jgi:hypothetical protein
MVRRSFAKCAPDDFVPIRRMICASRASFRANIAVTSFSTAEYAPLAGLTRAGMKDA